MAVANEQPLLLFLDDLQWADDASLSLLFHAGRRLSGQRILVVCAYRTAEVAAGRAGHPHPLVKIVAEFRRLSGDVVVDLGGHDRERDRYFVDAYLAQEPHRLDEAFHQALADHTKGHPLFTVELLRALQERGELVEDEDGHWVTTRSLDWMVLPDRVEAVIEERVGRLDETEREILTVASVEGERFTAQVVAQVHGGKPRELMRVLSHALQQRHRLVKPDGLVANGGPSLARYRFAHALFQHYLYNNLSDGERQLLHHEVGIALESQVGDNRDGVAAQLARHFSVAGDRERARRYHLQAGNEALETWAWAEAEHHLRRSLALEPTEQQKAELLYGLGRASFHQVRSEEAKLYLRQAVEMYLQLGVDNASILPHIYHTLTGATMHTANVRDALAVCEEGLVMLANTPANAGYCRLLLHKSKLTYHLGQKDEADELARQALTVRLQNL